MMKIFEIAEETVTETVETFFTENVYIIGPLFTQYGVFQFNYLKK